MMELQLGNTYVRENIYRLLVLMYSKSQLYVVRSLSRGLTLSDASNFMTRASRSSSVRTSWRLVLAGEELSGHCFWLIGAVPAGVFKGINEMGIKDVYSRDSPLHLRCQLIVAPLPSYRWDPIWSYQVQFVLRLGTLVALVPTNQVESHATYTWTGRWGTLEGRTLLHVSVQRFSDDSMMRRHQVCYGP